GGTTSTKGVVCRAAGIAMRQRRLPAPAGVGAGDALAGQLADAIGGGVVSERGLRFDHTGRRPGGAAPGAAMGIVFVFDPLAAGVDLHDQLTQGVVLELAQSTVGIILLGLPAKGVVRKIV